jgi:hypothetical protein
VVAYVEDTSECGLRRNDDCDDDCRNCPYNFEPRMILEIADCADRINLEFDADSEAARANSLHKLDTLITALRIFRAGVEAEFEHARAAAGDKDVAVAGGADVVQQYLAAGLLDELQIHVVPLLLGDGVRLFDRLDTAPVELEATRVVESPSVTHLRFRVDRRST